MKWGSLLLSTQTNFVSAGSTTIIQRRKICRVNWASLFALMFIGPIFPRQHKKNSVSIVQKMSGEILVLDELVRVRH